MCVLRLLALLIGLAASGGAWATDASIRIGFLLNFSRFTEWPESILKTNMPITICLAPGDAEMSAEFTSLDRQLVKNRAIRAIQITRPSEVARCHVLYLPSDLAQDPEAWLAIAEQAGSLTVSDRPNFVDEGGIIGLVLVGGRYRFNANLAKAKQVNLLLSANLLKLAQSVK